MAFICDNHSCYCISSHYHTTKTSFIYLVCLFTEATIWFLYQYSCADYFNDCKNNCKIKWAKECFINGKLGTKKG